MNFITSHMARVALALVTLAVANVQAATTIVILRHAEKQPAGLGQLTCQGLNRSLALAPQLITRFGTPTTIYASNPSTLKVDGGVAYAYVRPLATIEPLAIRAGLPVNIQWGMTEIEPLAAQLLSKPDGIYVVAWEHHWAESLARRLLSGFNGNPAEVPTWVDSDFDSLFVIRTLHDVQGKTQVSFSHEHQGLDAMPRECSDGLLITHP